MSEGEPEFQTVEDFDLSQKSLASAISLPAQRVNDVFAGRRQITRDMALRLGRYFGKHPGSWLSLRDEWPYASS